MAHPLDNPVLASLVGPHAALAERRGRVARYPADVAPFAAVPDEPTAADWADLAALAGPGGVAWLVGPTGGWPARWSVVAQLVGYQMVAESAAAGTATAAVAPAIADDLDAETIRLTAMDVPEMLDLVARTRPGPFLPRTVELGSYRGVRRRGELVAMAGERLHPTGWTEVSAVCVDPRARGEGLARLLVDTVMAGVRARGEVPVLHVTAENSVAMRLYVSLGFAVRRPMTFTGLRMRD